MKAIETVSKSKVMNRAHAIFNSRNTVRSWQHLDFSDFGNCLSRAWAVEKENVKSRNEKAAQEAEVERVAKWQASDEYKKADKHLSPDPDSMKKFYDSNAYKGD